MLLPHGLKIRWSSGGQSELRYNDLSGQVLRFSPPYVLLNRLEEEAAVSPPAEEDGGAFMALDLAIQVCGT